MISFSTQANDILTVGDSLTAGLSNTGGTIRCAAQGNRVVAASDQSSCRGNGVDGVGGWQPILKRARNVRVYNFGNTGEQTNEILARFNSHLASRPSKYVLIMGGTNDVIKRVPTSTIINNLRAMINSTVANNRIPIIGTIPPLKNSVVGSANGGVIALNQAIIQIPNVKIANHFAALDPNWSANTSGDFIHLGSTGNAIVAQGWLTAINELEQPAPVPEAPKPPITPILGLLNDD